ncbi:MAG: tetratricopeptide repeat protein, partial [Woeseiaceae bacterium]
MPAANPTYIKNALERGRSLIDHERWLDAAPLYDELVQLEPANITIRYDYGTVQLGLGACEKAFDVFDALIREGTDRPAIRFMRARSSLDLG